MRVSGERVSTARAGFNPTWQRHVAAYARCALLLAPEGPVLDLGCGVGHSFHLLAPRLTVGVDRDPRVLRRQPRPTLAADMRALPLPDASFASVLAIHAIEHVPDPERVLAEARRVLRPGGVAVFVTPNRLTFARPDEVVDPYHHFEADPDQLRRLCAGAFAHVELLGLFGSARYRRVVEREHRRLDRLLALDRLRLRRHVPRRLRQLAYDAALRAARRRAAPDAPDIAVGDFTLAGGDLPAALDLVAVCRA